MNNDLESRAEAAFPGRPRVSVYCDVAARHSKKHPEILVIVFSPGTTHAGEPWTFFGGSGPSSFLQYSEDGSIGQIVGPRQLVRSHEGARDHLRYVLTCPRCGMHTVQLRAERLMNILDALQRAGITSITLRALASTIGSGITPG